MKKLDIYIIKKFLGTFFYAISLIVVIIIIFDISEKVDDFIEKKAPLYDIIFTYYMNFIPYFVNQFSALFCFIAVIFFTSKMASNTEIVAILSSGVSFKRMLVPYFISALFLALFSFFLTNFVIPPANARRLAFEDTYFRNAKTNRDRNIHMQINQGTYVYVESFNSETNTGYQFALEKINNAGLYYKMTSDLIRYDSTSGKWRIQNYFIRTMAGLNENISKGRSLDTVLNMKPADFSKDIDNIETMNYSQLRAFIEKEKLKGSDNVAFSEVEKHKRIAFPFATLVLTLIGVSLSSRKARGGIGFHLGAGLTISFAFILFMQISTTFGTYGNLPPYLAVWIPNIIFGLLGLFLLRMAPK
jgi:lipopolysaccharide export system permease protein